MNRLKYFDYINEKLSTLAFSIESSGKLNVLSLHNHCECFYRDFLNELFGWQLENINDKVHNYEAIDLICHSNKLIIQVSSTSTKTKIESTLKKDIMKIYLDYNFKFVSISKNSSNLRKMKFRNAHSIAFNPLSDIIDVTSILDKVLSLTIDKQNRIYDFIKKELGNEGGLCGLKKARPLPKVTPSEIQKKESIYIGKILAAYSEYLKSNISSALELDKYPKLREDFERHRKTFFSAESLKEFSRDINDSDSKYFEEFKEEVFDGIINTIDEDAKDGFERLRKVLDRATSLQITDNPLVGSSNINDRKGICHHLANEKDEVRWTRK